MCIPKIPSSHARLRKSLNIFMSLRPIQTNETPKESPRWALRDHISTTLWPLKPLHHNCNMHTKISARLVEKHTDPLISQQDMAWSGRMRCQKKALIGLYKDVSSWLPCHSNLGITTAVWTQKISPATIAPWGARFWQTGFHIKALDFWENITQSGNCNSITSQPRRYLQVGVLENILHCIFVGFRARLTLK